MLSGPALRPSNQSQGYGRMGSTRFKGGTLSRENCLRELRTMRDSGTLTRGKPSAPISVYGCSVFKQMGLGRQQRSQIGLVAEVRKY